MDTYWIPGVNHLGTHGRWAFAEFTDVYQIQSDFAAKVESEFNKMIESVVGTTSGREGLVMAKIRQNKTEEERGDAHPR